LWKTFCAQQVIYVLSAYGNNQQQQQHSAETTTTTTTRTTLTPPSFGRVGHMIFVLSGCSVC